MLVLPGANEDGGGTVGVFRGWVAALCAWSVALVSLVAFAPAGEALGPVPGFNYRCFPAGTGAVDPIVSPGRESSHVHEFFSSMPSPDTTTAQKLRELDHNCVFPSNPGLPTYEKDSYWMPQLTLRDGTTATPKGVGVYFRKTPGEDARSVQPPPTGLKYVVGSPDAAGPQRGVYWKCIGPDRRSPGYAMPDRDCAQGENIRLFLDMPSCSDGRADSRNHKAHMAYPVPGKGCPASHPRPVPFVTLDFGFEERTMRGARMVDHHGGTVAPHADFFNGTKYAVWERHLNECIRTGAGCGGAGTRGG